MRISDGSSDVCSSDLYARFPVDPRASRGRAAHRLRLSRSIGGRTSHGGVGSRRTRGRPQLQSRQGGLQAVRLSAQVSLPPSVQGPGYDRASQAARSEEHTSELQSLMRISYAVFCLKKKTMRKSTVDTTK